MCRSAFAHLRPLRALTPTRYYSGVTLAADVFPGRCTPAARAFDQPGLQYALDGALGGGSA